MLPVLIAFALGALLGLRTTPILRNAALKFGIVDRPNSTLKTHTAPVAYLGGLAVFLAFLVTLGVVGEFSHQVLGILLAGTIMLLVGLIDDLGVLSPWEKLAGQCVAVAVLLKAGIYVKLIFLPPGVGLVVSVAWLLVVINAMNIIDIMDGLASGTSAIAALFLAGIAVWMGDTTVAVMSAALAGSLVGFLRHNFQPASIYLGDAGSLFLGLTLAALAMNGAYTQQNWLGALTPALVLGVPLFDLLFVSFVRLRKGLSPFRGSADHFALHLRRAGLSVRQVVAITYCAGVALGVSGVGLMQAAYETIASMILFGTSSCLLAAAVLLRRGAPSVAD